MAWAGSEACLVPAVGALVAVDEVEPQVARRLPLPLRLRVVQVLPPHTQRPARHSGTGSPPMRQVGTRGCSASGGGGEAR